MRKAVTGASLAVLGMVAMTPAPALAEIECSLPSYALDAQHLALWRRINRHETFDPSVVSTFDRALKHIAAGRLQAALPQLEKTVKEGKADRWSSIAASILVKFIRQCRT